MPLPKHGFADRLKNDEGSGDPETDEPSNDEPAKVAMGRMISLTGGPSCIAARRADVRSLAMPVPAGTLKPTFWNRTFQIGKPWKTFPRERSRLRTTDEKVYAFVSGLRTFFQLHRTGYRWHARGVPSCCGSVRSDGYRGETSGGALAAEHAHGRDDNPAGKIAAGPDRRQVVFTQRRHEAR